MSPASPDPQDIDVGQLMRSENFNAACRALRARIEAGEPMRLKDMADAIGLPLPLFEQCIAASIFMAHGIQVVFADDEPKIN